MSTVEIHDSIIHKSSVTYKQQEGQENVFFFYYICPTNAQYMLIIICFL